MSFFGCTTYDAEKYVYKEGANIPGVSTEETHWGEMIYKKGSYDFFPRFYSMTPSYSQPNSRVIIYSAERESIYLKNIEIISAENTYSDKVGFYRELTLDKYNEEKRLNYVGLELFSHKNTDLSKYWGEGDITVILRYVNSSGEEDDIVFEFKLSQGRTIAWTM